MEVLKTLKSTYGPCTNFLSKYGNGIIEARYVRKNPSYVACYVSSHNGCKMGCLFCHLTQNNDITMNHVDIPTYGKQIRTVLNHYKKQVDVYNSVKATRCNINFMSKGDALANKYVVNEYDKLYNEMYKICQEFELETKPNISTIMPYTVKNHSLLNIFHDKPAYLYYSLYSLNSNFRKKWLPNAIPYQDALDKLKEYQLIYNRVITFHWSIIKGQNDDIKEVNQLAKELRDRNFNGKLNIVRFNPHPNVSDEEASPEKVKEIFDILADVFKNPKSYIVPRLDVKTKTPCGMFVPLEELDKMQHKINKISENSYTIDNDSHQFAEGVRNAESKSLPGGFGQS